MKVQKYIDGKYVYVDLGPARARLGQRERVLEGDPPTKPKPQPTESIVIRVLK